MHRIKSRRVIAVLAAAGFATAGASASAAEGDSEAVPADADSDVEDAVIQVTYADVWLDQVSESNSGGNLAGNFHFQHNDSDQSTENDAGGGDWGCGVVAGAGC